MVIGSMVELKEHAEMMRKMPGMQHTESNMITPQAGAARRHRLEVRAARHGRLRLPDTRAHGGRHGRQGNGDRLTARWARMGRFATGDADELDPQLFRGLLGWMQANEKAHARKSPSACCSAPRRVPGGPQMNA